MTPLVRCKPVRKKLEELRAQAHALGIPIKEMKRALRHMEHEEMWQNDMYVVFKHVKGDWIELSIRRQDRTPITDWRDKQAIKNQLVGPENEGLELYPAESRLLDTANQYWLFVRKDPEDRIPVGFTDGRNTNNENAGGSVQRPLEEKK